MDWTNLFVLLLLVAGHTELVVTIINRLHGLPLPIGLLKVIRRLHELLIPIFPVVLFWSVGVRSPGLLTGGHWENLPWGWKLYLAFCLLGAVGLVISSTVRQLRPLPAAQESNHSQIVDIEQRLGFRPIGSGPYQLLTHVPGNEIFRIQVSEKTYCLPRLPAELDGLSILHLSDLHYTGTLDRPFYEQIAELASHMSADLIVFTGDLLDRQQLVQWLPETLGRLQAPLGCHFILGNHDWELEPSEIRRHMSALGWNDVAGKTRSLTYQGQTFVIAGTERPWMGQHPDFSDVPPDRFRLLLSHTPDNLHWARQQQVDLMLSGHNHGGQVVLVGIGPVYSPSVYGCRYAGGVFWRDPTLLYVSRGLAGRHPLRLRCLPELTKLILRAPQVEKSERHRP